MGTKLQPCRKCKGKPKLVRSEYGLCFYECLTLGCCNKTAKYDTRAEAVRRWNACYAVERKCKGSNTPKTVMVKTKASGTLTVTVEKDFDVSACPFCKSINLRLSADEHQVRCVYCGGGGPYSEVGPEGAIDLWNDRGGA